MLRYAMLCAVKCVRGYVMNVFDANSAHWIVLSVCAMNLGSNRSPGGVAPSQLFYNILFSALSLVSVIRLPLTLQWMLQYSNIIIIVYYATRQRKTFTYTQTNIQGGPKK